MKFFILIPFCFAAISMFAQSANRPGYVILNSGDTLLGNVDYKETRLSFQRCEIEPSGTFKTLTFSPAEARGYGFIDDKQFVTQEVVIGTDTTLAFFEKIVSGRINLYKFEDRLFVNRDNEKLFELKDEEKIFYVPGRGRVIKKGAEFRGILNMLMSDCPQLKKRIEKSLLSEREITILTESYNVCKGGATVSYKGDKPWVKTHFSVSSGLNFPSLQVKANNQSRYLEGKYQGNVAPLFNTSINVYFPRLRERYALHTGIMYSKSVYEKELTNQNRIQAKVAQIRIPIGVRYNFEERPVTPYVMGGFAYAINIDKESNYISGSSTMDQSSKLKDNELGGWICLGGFKSISKGLNGFVEIRYERTNGIFNIESTATMIQLIAGISLK